MSFKLSLSSFTLTLSLLFSATSAFAAVDDFDDLFVGVECIGGGEQDFCVQEIPGQYQVTNNLFENVSAFGVTNLEISDTSVDRPDWSSFSITSEAWDSGYEFMFWGAGVVTTDFGSFADLFGVDPVVNFYFLAQESLPDWTLKPGEIDPFFYFNTDTASDVTAFNASAQVLHTTVSSVAAVPEPSTYAMLLAGLGLLGLAKRREQSY